MSEFTLPWLEAAILTPLLGTLWVACTRGSDGELRRTLIVSGATLIFALCEFLEFFSIGAVGAHDRWNLVTRIVGADLVVVDELSAPLLPVTALIYFLTVLATARSAARRFSFRWALVSEGVVLATLCCKLPWLIITLLVLGALLPMIEQSGKGRSVRLHGYHLALFALLSCSGQLLIGSSASANTTMVVGIALLALAMTMRCGLVPFHCWITDLFEHGSFGTALMFTTPIVGAYGLIRLVLPIAPQWILDGTALLSLTTAAYAASMALIQLDSRRFFGFIAVGHSALVVVGLDIVNPVGLTGALCMWLAVGISLTGFGLTLRCVEARTGRLSLAEFHGLSRHTPMLAGFFVLTGLASVGFPGTIGFIGADLLFEGANEASPWTGTVLVLAAALNGIAMMNAYFRVFTGCTHTGTINLDVRRAERIAILVLTLLIVGGGLHPQPGVSSRHHAALELIKSREENGVGRRTHRDVHVRPAPGTGSTSGHTAPSLPEDPRDL